MRVHRVSFGVIEGEPIARVLLGYFVSISTQLNSILFANHITFNTGVIQLIPPVLSSETLLHILLSSEYSGFRPSTTAVVIISAPVSVSTGPKFRRYSAQLSRKIVKKVFIVISNVFPTFLTYR